MYILQNAWKNIGRNKGRNILMGVIILLIIAASAVALIINNTANGIIDRYKERFSSEVSITPNMQKLQEQAMRDAQASGNGNMIRIQRPTIPPEQYVAFGNSQYLKEARYSASLGVHNSGGIKPIDEDKGGGGSGMLVQNINGASSASSPAGDFYANVLGYNFIPENFSDGSRQIAEGNFPENDGECIISKDLLVNSGLKIGDKINLTSTLKDSSAMFGDENVETCDIAFTLTIVGYYDDLTDEYPDNFQANAFVNRRNEILTTVDTVISQMREGFGGISVDGKYYLGNPEDLTAFAAELYSKGLDGVWDVATDEESYNTIVEPVEGLKSITFIFLIVVLLLGAVILVLLSTIAIRERKYEIGVLRAMGMKKSRVALGLLAEIITITLVCLVLGLGTGIAAAQPVSDILLDSQVKQIESSNNISGFGGLGTMRIGAAGMGDTSAEALKSMDISMNIATVCEIILVSLILAVSASGAGITHVTKYEPIKILSERN